MSHCLNHFLMKFSKPLSWLQSNIHMVIWRKNKGRCPSSNNSSSSSVHSSHSPKVSIINPDRKRTKAKKGKKTTNMKEAKREENWRVERKQRGGERIFLFFIVKKTKQNNLLDNVHKSVRPPTFYGGLNLKPKLILSLLGIMKSMFNEEFVKKEKLKANFVFAERTNSFLVDSY